MSRFTLRLAIVLQAAISAGDGLALIALANRVYQSSHASWAVAAVFLAMTVPITTLAPLAGLMLDRLPTKPVLVSAAAGAALVALGLAMLNGVPATLALAFGFGVCAAILQPGLGAVVPRLAGGAAIIRANSYLQAATWAGFSAGPLLAGLLISTAGSGAAFCADAGLYVAGAAGLWALRLAPRLGVPGGMDGAGGRPRLSAELRAGLGFLRTDREAGMLVLTVGAVIACANMAVVAEVVFAEHVLRAGPGGYSLLVAGWTAGMVAGTLAGGRVPTRWLVATALTGTVATGAGVALAGTAVVLWQAVAAYGFGGLASGTETVATRSVLNHRAPEEVAGRVFALYSGVLFGATSLAMAVAGGLLTVMGARALLVVAGCGGMLAGVAGSIGMALRRRGHRGRPAAGGAGRGINRAAPAVDAPVPSRQMQEKIAALRAMREAAADQPVPTLEESRSGFDTRDDLYPLPSDVVVTDAGAAGVPARWITVPGAGAGRVLLYLHGGGYQIGSFRSHAELASRLGRASGMRVLLPEYRLAPEHPFPAAVEDALGVWRWLRTVPRLEACAMAVAGDSAGGGLALALMAALRDGGEDLPAAAVLISPWTDLSCSGASMTERVSEDPVFVPGLLRQLAADYLAGADPRTPLASPLFARLDGLPPLLIQVGSAELLLSDAEELAAAATAAGVDVTVQVGDGLPHVYPGLLGTPEAAEATDQAGAFLRDRVNRVTAARA